VRTTQHLYDKGQTREAGKVAGIDHQGFRRFEVTQAGFELTRIQDLNPILQSPD